LALFRPTLPRAQGDTVVSTENDSKITV
jgi:hypothetical protein